MMLADGLTELLFKLSGGGDAVFCLLGETNCFEPPSSYTNDNFTEKVNIISRTIHKPDFDIGNRPF